MHLEPLSFEEFLLACSKPRLLEYMQAYTLDIQIPIAIHEQLMTLFKEYMIVGGMPRSVSSWTEKRSLQEVSRIQHSLIETYRDDFAKYSGTLEPERFDDIMLAIPRFLGQKIVYTKLNPLAKRPCRQARLITLIQSTSLS